MNRFITVIVLGVVVVAIGIVGLGFYRGWFAFTTSGTGDKSNLTLTMDQDKFQEDRKTATKSVHDLGRQVTGSEAVEPGSMDGTVVSVNGDKLTMTNKDGKEHVHTLAADVKVTCDGQVCTAADLKEGMRIRITTHGDAPHAATRIEALDKNPEFEKAG